jgi:NADPH:quinone reductase-like Zn-dependent oxidoreductase
MIASPINPSDVITVRGLYGRLPPLPATPGYEGVGIVEEGQGFWARRLVGRRVAVLNARGGNWAEKVVIPWRQAVPMPQDLPDEQAATFFVNPATALIMTRYVLKVPRSAWLLQTAAGSALGRMVIRLGQLYGFRTLNIVRRREQAEELLREGGTAAIATNDEDMAERVRALTDGAGVPFALDAVGGATGSALVPLLSRGGRLLVYGSLSMQPLPVDPRALLFGQRRVDGFWLSDWSRNQSALTMLWLFHRLKKNDPQRRAANGNRPDLCSRSGARRVPDGGTNGASRESATHHGTH